MIRDWTTDSITLTRDEIAGLAGGDYAIGLNILCSKVGCDHPSPPCAPDLSPLFIAGDTVCLKTGGPIFVVQSAHPLAVTAIRWSEALDRTVEVIAHQACFEVAPMPAAM